MCITQRNKVMNQRYYQQKITAMFSHDLFLLLAYSAGLISTQFHNDIYFFFIYKKCLFICYYGYLININ